MARGKRRGLPSRFELTLAGKVTLTFLVIAFCVALLHGSNPVLFVVSCLAATVLLSMLLTYLSPARLAVERSMPERVFSGAPFDVRLEIRNLSRWRPALGIGFLDTLQVSRRGEFTCGPLLPVLPPSRAAEVAYLKRLHRRGIYSISDCVAATRFPFALFERRVLLRSEPASRLVVLPPLGRLRRAGRRDLRERLSRPREAHHSLDGREEFHSIREFRMGDNPRLVHWKTSARAGKLMRRVMQDDSGEDLTVVLDTRTQHGLHSDARLRSLERAISCAATLLVEAARRGRRGAVYFPGGCARHTGSVQGVLPALEVLAGIEGGSEPCRSMVGALPLRRGSRILLLSLLGPAKETRRAAAARGFSLRVWDVSHADFSRIFTKR